MSYAPATIMQARAYLKQHTGLGDGALGIVGDNAHTYGYHLGRDRLPANDYSARAARDRAGLSNAASALDVGDFAGLVKLTAFLGAEARAGRLSDVRELIGPASDGRAYRWDHLDGWSAVQQVKGNSHEWHLHISYYRDSEGRSKLAPFQRFFGDIASEEEDDMLGLKRGDTGLRVRALQAWLSDAGYPVAGGIDGQYGPATAAALVRLRKAEGTANPSGDAVDEWAFRQLHRAQARRQAEAVGTEVTRQWKAALERALAGLPGLPDSITIDLPDRITVPVSPANDES